ncbi:MAG TPA: hypothetical protein VHY08_20195 [Bacillota bacterium]|nr:hypothetical protein [Bacillota bacterium]
MRKHDCLLFLLLAVSLLLFNVCITFGAPNKAIKVEAVGFFNHPPLRETRITIQEVCKQFGKGVELILHDEMTEDGQKFMKEKGLTGHVPTAIYINGSLAHKIDDRVVVFRDFVGQNWTGQDLQQVIELNLNGKKTAIKAPSGATTGW